jgi:hypothetical protein
MWNSGLKDLDYKFIDNLISEHMDISGTAVYCHLYEGVYDQTANGIANAAVANGGITSIQDPLLLENRDRKYSDTVYELRGTYNVGDLEGSMSQYAMFIQDDTVMIEFHLNDMLSMLGRRLIEGDVIELPHLRDDSIPGPTVWEERPAINKFYVITDAHKATDGYSSTWFAHIWRIKAKPMTASQEFQDILDKQATDPFGLDQGSIGDIMTTIGTDLGINEAIIESAKANFLHRNFETQHFWIRPGSELGDEYPFVWAGDGVPPNGYETLGAGTSFPQSADIGDYYLRTDYSPSVLFRRIDKGWQMQEINYQEQEWTSAHRLLWDFLNNTKDTTFKNGDVEKQKQALSKAVTKRKPGVDF